MELKQRDEEKRTRDYRIVFTVSTAVILLVVAIFIINSVFVNPLEGDWTSKDTGYHIEIDDDGEISIETTVNQIFVEVDAAYTIDKDAKIITIRPELNTYEEAAQDTENLLTAADIDAKLKEIMTSFDYSLEKDTLTLSEREYGEQFVFTRVK
jgi:hypothetical protein